ncbi:unnamed protein product [Acanthosepion pharaonis]|uniref:Uncharacterized protein n=1 Tax=Acanthosepion pharaonis TaxID=158019 RepID=A0A812DWI4_ACAPH|nr:unnamed protein product [Sepia pharaonis]
MMMFLIACPYCIHLEEQRFSYGQIYVACSRVGRGDDVFLIACPYCIPHTLRGAVLLIRPIYVACSRVGRGDDVFLIACPYCILHTLRFSLQPNYVACSIGRGDDVFLIACPWLPYTLRGAALLIRPNYVACSRRSSATHTPNLRSLLPSGRGDDVFLIACPYCIHLEEQRFIRPNYVACSRVGRDDDVFLIACPYMQGASLRGVHAFFIPPRGARSLLPNCGTPRVSRG